MSENIYLLLKGLRSTDPAVRDEATGRLWAAWHAEKGEQAELLLKKGCDWMEAGDLPRALRAFETAIERWPDFAEAHNKKATALYLSKRFREAIVACLQTVGLNPVHFGAWHGLGLCYMETGQYASARVAFRRALDVQPYANVNRQLIQKCQELSTA